MFCEVTAVTLTQVCAEYEDPVAGDSYLLVSLELPWTLGRYSVMGSQLPLISSFLLDQGRADVILTGENLTHASSLILWVWGCEMFLSPLRDLPNPFNVGRGCCEWGEEWAGSGKWERFQVLISFDVTLLVLPSSAGTHTFRKQRSKAAANDLAGMATWPRLLTALGSTPM